MDNKATTACDGDLAEPLRASRWWIAALLGLTVLAYLNGLPGGFVFDDYLLIRDDPAIRHPAALPRLFGLPFGEQSVSSLGAFRPLRTATYALDHALFGMAPWGFRLGNILYHLIATALAYLLLKELLRRRDAAFCGALFWAIHPVQTESVTYLSGRRDVLTGLFFLAAMLAFLAWRRRGWPMLLLGGLLTWIGIQAKAMCVTAPAAALLAGAWLTLRDENVRDSLRRLGRTVRAHWILAATGALVLAAMTLAALYVVQWPTAMADYWGGSPLATFATVLRVHLHQLGLILWPQTLSIDYSYNAFPVSESLRDPRALLAAAVVFPVLLAGAWGYLRGRAWGLGILLYFLTYLPVSHIIPHHELLADHFLYIPLLGAALVFGSLYAYLQTRAPRPAGWLAALILLLLAGRTVLRNEDYRDELRMWRATVRAYPDCARALTSYGLALELRGRTGEAESLYRRALAINPDSAYAMANLARIHMDRGEYKTAIPMLHRASLLEPMDLAILAWHSIALTEGGHTLSGLLTAREAIGKHPRAPMAHAAMGYALAAAGQKERAIGYLRRAAAGLPRDWRIHYALGVLLCKTGAWEEADAVLRASMENAPAQPEPRHQRGVALEQRGQLRQAEECWRGNAGYAPSVRRLVLLLLRQKRSREALIFARELAAHPEATARDAHLLARALEATGREKEALARLEEARHLPDVDAALLNDLGRLLGEEGRNAEAIGALRRAAEIDPSHVETRINLAVMLRREGKEKEARRHLREALDHASDPAYADRIRRMLAPGN